MIRHPGVAVWRWKCHGLFRETCQDEAENLSVEPVSAVADGFDGLQESGRCASGHREQGAREQGASRAAGTGQDDFVHCGVLRAAAACALKDFRQDRRAHGVNRACRWQADGGFAACARVDTVKGAGHDLVQ